MPERRRAEPVGSGSLAAQLPADVLALVGRCGWWHTRQRWAAACRGWAALRAPAPGAGVRASLHWHGVCRSRTYSGTAEVDLATTAKAFGALPQRKLSPCQPVCRGLRLQGLALTCKRGCKAWEPLMFGTSGAQGGRVVFHLHPADRGACAEATLAELGVHDGDHIVVCPEYGDGDESICVGRDGW